MARMVISGGYNKARKEQLQMTTEVLRCGENQEEARFFKVAKTDAWFCKLISGHASLGRGTHCIKLLKMIRAALKTHFHTSGAAQSSSADGEEHMSDSSASAVASTQAGTTPVDAAADKAVPCDGRAKHSALAAP